MKKPSPWKTTKMGGGKCLVSQRYLGIFQMGRVGSDGGFDCWGENHPITTGGLGLVHCRVCPVNQRADIFLSVAVEGGEFGYPQTQAGIVEVAVGERLDNPFPNQGHLLPSDMGGDHRKFIAAMAENQIDIRPGALVENGADGHQQ